MDSTIAAAYVAAGAAIATSVTSVLAARSAASKGAHAALKSAERTAKATLDATRHTSDTTIELARLTLAADADRRLWEKRAEVYVHVIADAIHRQVGRENRLKAYRMTRATEVAVDKVVQSYEASPFELEARVRAFASEQVIDAYNESCRANYEAFRVDATWKDVAQVAKDNPLGPEAVQVAKEPGGLKVKEALRVAREADDSLIAAVRAELHERLLNAPSTP